MQLTITKLLILLSLCGACGGLDTEQVLEVQMYGSTQTATGAEGDGSPDYLSFQLTEVSLIGSDGTTMTMLFNNEDERIFRVIDRAQKVFSHDIADYEDQVFSGLRLTFAPAITGGNEEHKDLSYTMSTASLIFAETLPVEKAQSITVINRIKWGNTVKDGVLTEPTYELSRD